MDFDEETIFNNIYDVSEVCSDTPSDDLSDDKNATKRKRPRTKSEQVRKLLSFMETHSDFTQGKTTPEQLSEWNNLIQELNAMGPPIYSSQRWRKVWTDHKGNKKRKTVPGNAVIRFNKEESNGQSEAHASAISDTKTDSHGNAGHKQSDAGISTAASISDSIVGNLHAEVFRKLGQILDAQNKTNSLYEELIKLLKTKSS